MRLGNKRHHIRYGDFVIADMGYYDLSSKAHGCIFVVYHLAIPI